MLRLHSSRTTVPNPFKFLEMVWIFYLIKSVDAFVIFNFSCQDVLLSIEKMKKQQQARKNLRVCTIRTYVYCELMEAGVLPACICMYAIKKYLNVVSILSHQTIVLFTYLCMLYVCIY